MSSLAALAVTASLFVGQAQEKPEGQERLREAMGWMIGGWEGVAEAKHSALPDRFNVKWQARWILERNCIQSRWTFFTDDGEFTASGMDIYGWDTKEEKLACWMFNGIGGRSVRHLQKHDKDGTMHWKGTYYSPDGKELPATYTSIADGKRAIRIDYENSDGQLKIKAKKLQRKKAVKGKKKLAR